jgi:polysaccharide biosynthesis transport protein
VVLEPDALSEQDTIMNEFVPLDHFYLFIRYWWVVVLATIIGGVAGFFFSRMHTPLYEATATFYINVDLSKVKESPLPLHDEDLALSMIQGALLHPQVVEELVQELKKSNPELDTVKFLANHTLERKNAFWELRYRDPDPLMAQEIVNLWAEKGYQEYLAQKSDGTIPAYVISTEPLLSGTPEKPIVYPPNQLILAGSALGFVIGLLVIELKGNSGKLKL